MFNVQIDKTTLLNLFKGRLKYWTRNNNILALYEDYLKKLIDCGCFENAKLDIDLIIDNLYINDTIIMNRKMLDDNDIKVDDSDKVLAKNEEKDLYVGSTY